ncbi:MAG: cysteine desulfurase sulfur acceptor subunit CsdE [Plesiomonas sp.]|uniref:cysteine desulfurase sulfur acceptor subunit CsdE n=1 Tax=Plesiomonas sp. TaxID=2486279 RepID=UPI003F3B617E
MYPHPFGHEISWDDLQQRFEACRLWEDRYRQLILLARKLPALPAEAKTEQIALAGCENNVWLGHQLLADGTLHFYADSEGRIVKGLLAVILTLVEGKTPAVLLKIDLSAALQQIGVGDTLSSSRSQGIAAIAARIQSTANAHVV